MKTLAAAIITFTLFGTTQIQAQSTPETQIAAGRKLFEQHCSECHGREGVGTDRAPSIVSFVTNAERSSVAWNPVCWLKISGSVIVPEDPSVGCRVRTEVPVQ